MSDVRKAVAPDAWRLEARGVTVRLGAVPALTDLSLALRPGWTAVVGPNGAGKSTLLRVLAGLQRSDAGAATLGGRPLASWAPRERARRIAWLAQHAEAGDELTVRETVALGRLPWLGLFAAPGAADAAAVESAMAQAGCLGWHERRLDELSGGERQRVLIARALAVDAPVLLLDEPTTHVDAVHQVALLRVLRRQAGAGRTVVSALHDLTLAFAADRVVLLERGRLRADGTPGDAALHARIVEVFGGAIRVERIGGRWAALPNLDG